MVEIGIPETPINEKIQGDISRMTFKQAKTSYFKYCQNERRQADLTLKAYTIDFRQFEKFMNDKNLSKTDPIKKLDRNFVKTYIQKLNSQYSIRSAKRKIASLKAFFSYLEYEDHIPISPFRKIKVSLPSPKDLPKILSLKEISKILDEAYKESNNAKTDYQIFTATRNIAIIELLFATGGRVSEIASLKTENIDIEDGSIKILGKGKKERILYIGNKLVLLALKKYKTLKDPAKGGETFFINRRGRPYSPQSIRFLLKRLAATVLPEKRITPHMFRHSFATLLLEEGVDIKYIQSFLGHSSIVTTQIYTHVCQDKQRYILEKHHPRGRALLVNGG